MSSSSRFSSLGPLQQLYSDSGSRAALTVTLLFNSDPSFTLPIVTPSATTTATLKLLIRSHRPSLSNCKLRLIHSGKVLPDGQTLSQLVPLQTPADSADPKGKQKPEDPEPLCIFIHCAVGPLLSASELATESSPAPQPTVAYSAETPSTLPVPQGFDRLLTQGFSEGEVAALRSQFNRLNPDLSTEDIRMLEDRWIDESVGQGQETLGGSVAGMYEDMLVGTVIGFFWPVSLWLAREDGVFTQRRQHAVLAGVCCNIFVGLVRIFG